MASSDRASCELLIRRGRAYVRLIETIDVLVMVERRQYDRAKLMAARAVAIRRLQRLTQQLNAATLAQILAASDRIWALIHDVVLN
jgi:hypothetical protein